MCVCEREIKRELEGEEARERAKDRTREGSDVGVFVCVGGEREVRD